ncbi:MAG: amino acid--tRNA ligase-related protein [Patescibacteria group bacterium]
MPLDDIRAARVEKLEKLRNAGIDPYPAKSWRTHTIAAALEGFDDFVANKDRLVLVGRVMAARGHGAITFMDLLDGTGTIQVLFKNQQPLETTDIGDFLEVFGLLFTTQKGEKTLEVEKYRMLTKSLLPLPEKWHGLQDVEERYRQRYVDMIMNPSVKDVFVTRGKVIEAMREFFIGRGYAEVQTPILQPMYGGGSARPFKSRLNALGMDVYMRISDEMYLKRLVVGGMERVFEFSTDFRNEGIDRSHNPEFTIMEAMTAYSDYEAGMKLVEAITEYVVQKITSGTKVTYQGTTIDFKAPWRRIRYAEALQEYGKATIEECEPFFIQPTILYDYPKATSPLAKPKHDNPEIVERFEHYINGMEVGNNYSELTDASILEENWRTQEEALKKGDEEAQRMDRDYLHALEIGMPPTCGIAISIDRMTMLLTDQHSIRDVIPFPFMRPKDLKETVPGKAKESKIAVAIINRAQDMEPWQEMNTIAHLNAAFGARLGRELFMQDTIATKDYQKINLNIQHAIMIKVADSNKAICNLVDQAKELDLDVAEFTKEMLETTDDKKVIEWTKGKNREDIDYYGVLIFGKKSLVEKLTGDLKLFS